MRFYTQVAKLEKGLVKIIFFKKPFIRMEIKNKLLLLYTQSHYGQILF